MLSSSVDGSAHQFAATYLVNDVLAIDAGSIGFAKNGSQMRVRSVLISHGHLDHVGTLPIFIDNVYEPGPGCPTVYASQHSIDILKTHFFNEVVWPDVIRLSREESPFVRFVTLEDAQPVTINNFVVTPVALNHIIPTLGFIVDDGTSAVAFISNTAPTDAIWGHVRQNPRLRAVFIEAAFPNSMTRLAKQGWEIPWDQMISREHADLCWKNGQLQVHCLDQARNPIIYRGKPAREASIAPSEWFQIGNTTFHASSLVAEEESVHHAASAAVEFLSEENSEGAEQTFSTDQLRKAAFRNADRQMELLEQLPEKNFHVALR